jgi:hypothetical protein
MTGYIFAMLVTMWIGAARIIPLLFSATSPFQLLTRGVALLLLALLPMITAFVIQPDLLEPERGHFENLSKVGAWSLMGLTIVLLIFWFIAVGPLERDEIWPNRGIPESAGF